MQIKKLAIKCLAIIASMSVLVGCGQAKTDEEIEKENEMARKSVDEHIKNSGNIKTIIDEAITTHNSNVNEIVNNNNTNNDNNYHSSYSNNNDSSLYELEYCIDSCSNSIGTRTSTHSEEKLTSSHHTNHPTIESLT